ASQCGPGFVVLDPVAGAQAPDLAHGLVDMLLQKLATRGFRSGPQCFREIVRWRERGGTGLIQEGAKITQALRRRPALRENIPPYFHYPDFPARAALRFEESPQRLQAVVHR